jgi:hypothetical protein
MQSHPFGNWGLYAKFHNPTTTPTFNFQDPQHEVLRVFYIWTVCMYLSDYLSVLSHISRPVIGQRGSW